MGGGGKLPIVLFLSVDNSELYSLRPDQNGGDAPLLVTQKPDQTEWFAQETWSRCVGGMGCWDGSVDQEDRDGDVRERGGRDIVEGIGRWELIRNLAVMDGNTWREWGDVRQTIYSIHMRLPL